MNQVSESLIINFSPAGESTGHCVALKELITSEFGEVAAVVDSRVFTNKTSAQSCSYFLEVLAQTDPRFIFFIGSAHSLRLNRADF